MKATAIVLIVCGMLLVLVGIADGVGLSLVSGVVVMCTAFLVSGLGHVAKVIEREAARTRRALNVRT